MRRLPKYAYLTLIALAAFFARAKTLYPAQESVSEVTAYLEYVPSNALLLACANDPAQLLKMFDDSTLKSANKSSEAYLRFTRSKLYMKMERRFKDINAAFTIDLDTAFLKSASDRNALLAIYDIGEMTFLMVSKIGIGAFEKTALNSKKDKFETRRSGDYQFYFLEDKNKNISLMFTWYDDTLFLSNDLAVFESSLKLFGKKNGDEKSVLDEPGVRKLFANKKLKVDSAGALVYLDFALINKAPHFKKYFLFKDQKDYLEYDKMLISADFNKGSYVERRVTLPVEGIDFDAQFDAPLTSAEEAGEGSPSDYLTASTFKSDIEKDAFLEKNVMKAFFSSTVIERDDHIFNRPRGRANLVSKKISDYLKGCDIREGVTYFSLNAGDARFSVSEGKCVVIRCADGVDENIISEYVKEFINSLFLKKIDVEIKGGPGLKYVEMPVFNGLNIAFSCKDDYFIISNSKEYLIAVKEKMSKRNIIENNPAKVIKVAFKKDADDFNTITRIIADDYKMVDRDTGKFFTENVKSLLDSVGYVDNIKYVKKPYIDYLYEELTFSYLR